VHKIYLKPKFYSIEYPVACWNKKYFSNLL